MLVVTLTFEAEMFETAEIAFTLYGEAVSEGVVVFECEEAIDRQAVGLACALQGVSVYELSIKGETLEKRSERIYEQAMQYYRAADAVHEVAKRNLNITNNYHAYSAKYEKCMWLHAKARELMQMHSNLVGM